MYEKPRSPREIVSQQRRNTGFEILSLLESEEDAQPEPPTKCTVWVDIQLMLLDIAQSI